jgi:hypothetical protein
MRHSLLALSAIGLLIALGAQPGFAHCGYHQTVDPATGRPILVYMCDNEDPSTPPQPQCSWQTVVDPETGQPVTVWVCH